MAYNGWANYDTWNVALWFNNDYGMYAYVHYCDKHYKEPTYLDMCEWLGIESTDETPDGVRYLGDSIDTGELDDLLFEDI